MALFAKILKKIFHHPCLKYRKIAHFCHNDCLTALHSGVCVGYNSIYVNVPQTEIVMIA